MMFTGVVNNLINKAKLDKKRIVLPESSDLRVLKATKIIVENDIADVILIGDIEEIEFLLKFNNIELDLSKVTICNPLTNDKRQLYIDSLYELRKHKGISMNEVIELINDNVYFGTMMVKLKDADGLVSGAIHSTADTLRAAFQIIKTEESVNSASSFFIMEVPETKLDNKLYIFSDCGVLTNPSSEELADIAVSSAKSLRDILNIEPKVGLLSYSTLGSGTGESVDKVVEAVNILKTREVDFVFDGELQVDACVVPSVSKLKAPNSEIKGDANVLIFPDLQSGNIGYKLVQRFANGTAIGPLIQGLNSPINDLSRGCNVEEIIAAVACTSIQADIREDIKHENIDN